MTEPASPRPSTGAGDADRRHRTGLVTLLFTDMVGSTALKQRLGDRASSAFFDQHHQIVRQTLGQFPSGREIETAGDSFLITFDAPSDAVQFALRLQSRLRALSLEQNTGALDRIGIHVGEVVIKEDQPTAKPRDLYGIPIDTCARIMSLAGGGQTLMSRFAFDTARPMLRGEELGDLQWLNHGAYQLKGIDEPIEVCEVRPAGSATSPPTTNEKASRLATDGDLVLGWRPALEQLVPATRWKLISKLGEGGFGEVWLGQDEVLKEKRVFKFCFKAELVRSLKRELTLFRILKEKVGEHPNIASIRQFNFETAPFYIEMDYVPGHDLKAWCDTQRGAAQVAERVKLEVVAQIADALQAAHQCGIVHRDVKPGNILISDSKSIAAKLTDFGIGQVLSEEYLAGMTRAGFTETMMGSSSSGTGTQMYMAPELLAGKPASTRSDIYSLGVVLYQLLISDFSRAVTVDWARRITDPLLREDLERCFAGDPHERFGSAAELARNLRNLPARRAVLEQQKEELAARERAAYRQGVVRTAGLAAVIVALVGCLAVVAFYQSRQASRSAHAATESQQQSRRHLYVANLNLAQQAWEQNDLVRLRQLLNDTQESPDRGFEWFYWQRQMHLPLQTIRGHLKEVYAVAFSPDGQRIVTGSFDNTAKVWDAATGRLLLTLTGHTTEIRSAAFSPDGQRIVTGSHDYTAKVWDAISGTNLLTLKGHRAQILSVAFSPDGQRIATSGHDLTARVWDAATGRQLIALTGHTALIWSVAFSPDGQRIVTAGGDETVRVWEAANGHHLLKFKSQALSATFSPDSQRIVSGSGDNTARVWEAASGHELFTLKGHGHLVRSVAFSPDGRWIVTSSLDHTAKVWDAANGREIFTLKGHSRIVPSAAFSPDGQRIVTGSVDHTVKLWEADSGREVRTLTGHDAAVYSVAFSPDNQRLVTASWDNTAKVWDVASGRELLSLKGHKLGILSAAYSPDNQRIVTGSWDETARVWDAASGRELLTLNGHTASVWSVAFSPDGQRIVTGSYDQTAKVWDAASGRLLLTLTGHGARIWSVAFSPDSRRIATGSDDQTAKVWDAVSGTNLLTLKGHSGLIKSVAFSPDGQRFVTGSYDRTAKVWDAVSGTNRLTLKGHGHQVRSVAFSPDGRRIVTGSADQTAKVWEAASGQELLTLGGHDAPIWSVAFSPDGHRIATGSADKTARIWQAARADEVAAWQEEELAGEKYLAALQRERTAEGEPQRIARAGGEGEIKQWLILAPIYLATGQSPAEGLDAEVIESEGRLRPRAGEGNVTASGELNWQEVAQEDYVLDFNAILGQGFSGRCVAYAVCYLRSEAEQRGLRMLVGSDDEAKVFLNGKLIHKYPVGRGFVADQDTVPDITLNAGLNVLVFKVVNEFDAWKGSIRFTDAQGNPVKGIQVTLDPEGKN